MGQYSKVSVQRQLGVCAGSKLSAKFKAPEGSKLFQLVLAGSDQFAGSATVGSDRQPLRSYPFDRASAVGCNWLAREGFSNAWILTWKAEPRLEFTAGEIVDVNIDFTTLPGTNASVWISYVQPYRYRKKDGGEIIVP